MLSSLRNQFHAFVLGSLTAIGATGCGQGLQRSPEQPSKALQGVDFPPALRQFSLATPTIADRQRARVDCKELVNAKLFSRIDDSISVGMEGNRQAALRPSHDFPKVETQPRDREYCYARAVLDELSSHSQCDRYVAALKHVLTKHPGMREQCLDMIAAEHNGRFGDKGADLLYYFAQCRPAQTATLASRVGEESKRLLLPGGQKGFPAVAAEMRRRAAEARLSRSQ